jgi:hypothetical protein
VLPEGALLEMTWHWVIPTTGEDERLKPPSEAVEGSAKSRRVVPELVEGCHPEQRRSAEVKGEG